MNAPATREVGSILVTGASSGIGAAVAGELGHRGFTVGCLSRRGSVPDAPGVTAFAADVTDHAATGAALQKLVDMGGPLRGLVNAAGIQVGGPSAEVTADTARTLWETNFLGALVLCQHAYPHLKAADGGLIVNVGSFFDRLGAARNTAYAASKAALGSLTRCLAVEWARDAIRVVNVAPGYILTDLNAEFAADVEMRSRVERRIPVRRLGEADEVGRLVGALYSESIGFLTGTTIYIDGGQGIAP